MKKYEQLSYILSSPPCISIWDTQEDNGGHKESTQVVESGQKKTRKKVSQKIQESATNLLGLEL